MSFCSKKTDMPGQQTDIPAALPIENYILLRRKFITGGSLRRVMSMKARCAYSE
jgi:hypothetical protein